MMPARFYKVKPPEKPKLLNESEAAYIGWGADTQLTCGKELPHIYIFFRISGRIKSLLQDYRNNW